MCVVCALCVSVLWHSRTSALSHLAVAALLTPARSHTGSHLPTAPCVPRCTTSAFCVVPHCLVLCRTLHCVCPAALLLWAGGSGQWNSCNALPDCLGAVGSGPPAIHCPTAWGQWAVQFLQCTASLPGGSGQCNSCNTLPHCLGAVGSGPPAMHCPTAWGSGQCNSCNTLPHCPGGGGQCNSCNALPRCLGAVGIASSAMQCVTAWGQWAAQLLQRTASLPRGSGQCNSCNALPHCLGAVGSGTPATHCLTAWGQWAVQLLQCTASPPGGSGQWNACNAPPHCLGAVGSGTPAMHCPTAWGQWAVQLLQCTASLPWGSGQWTSCNALPVPVLCCVVLLVGCAVFFPVVVSAFCGALSLVLCVPCFLRSVRCGALLCWLWCLAALCRVMWRCAVVWCCAVVFCCRFAVLFVCVLPSCGLSCGAVLCCVVLLDVCAVFCPMVAFVCCGALSLPAGTHKKHQLCYVSPRVGGGVVAGMPWWLRCPGLDAAHIPPAAKGRRKRRAWGTGGRGRYMANKRGREGRVQGRGVLRKKNFCFLRVACDAVYFT